MPSTTVRHLRWTDLPKEPVTDQLSRRLVTGERMMLAQVYLDKGCIVPRHSHENEQITWIVEGALKFWIGADGKEEVIVRAGEENRTSGGGRFAHPPEFSSLVDQYVMSNEEARGALRGREEGVP